MKRPEQEIRAAAERDGSATYAEGHPKMHRHVMQWGLHRDDECTLGVLPDGSWATSRRRVYVFDDDYLDEHERLLLERAWDEGWHDHDDEVGVVNPYAGDR